MWTQYASNGNSPGVVARGQSAHGATRFVLNRGHMSKPVERTEILQLIRDKVKRIADQTDLPRMIVNIHGISGIGKTHLLQQILDDLQSNYAVISLNFDPQAIQSSLGNICSWDEVLDLLRQVPTLPYFPEQITFVNEEVKPAQEVTIACNVMIEQVKERLEGDKPFLLLLDNLDDLPYWKWVQEKIIKPLLDQQRTLIVTTSQSPLFWHFWELREQCRPVELHPFSFEQTRMFLQNFQKEVWADSLYSLTMGYPLGLDYMIRLLNSEKTGTPLELNDILLKRYRHTLLDQLTQQLPDKVKSNIDIEIFLRTIVELGSSFDLTSLRKKINLPPGRVNNTITSLNSRGFFAYDREKHTYQLKPLIRTNLYPEVQDSS